MGANLGDREAALAHAVYVLGCAAEITALSSLYATAPVGPPQPEFLNAALRVRWSGAPRELLDLCLRIEAAAGRVRRERWGPRTLDLDILWARGLVVDKPGLTVPHPRLAERAFALLPLLEVAPDARDPRTGARYGDLAPEGDILRLPARLRARLPPRPARSR